ncbi:MAG: YfbK domain-containing protein [Verrucomicrobiota bacterium]
MKPEDLNPENNLEVRITALLLGELSAEEAAEVQAAIAQDPELMRLHDRLKVVLGLVREAVPTTELPADAIPEPLTLAHERREELLAIFKGGSPKVKEQKIIRVSFWQRYQKDLLKLAAMVVALLGMGWLMLPKREQEAYMVTAGQVDLMADREGFMEMMTSSLKRTAPATPASVTAFSVPASPSSHDFSKLTTEDADGVVTVTITNASSASGTKESFLAYDSAATTPDNRPQVRFSNGAASPGETPVTRGRTVRGVTTLPSKAKTAAPAATPADAGGFRFSYSEAKGGISPAAGVPAQTIVVQDSSAPMGNLQTRHYNIALPQAEGAEVAQVKELSDLTLAGGIREESRMGRASKDGQGAQGGGGGVGGGARGNSWGYQQNEFSGTSSLLEVAGRDAVPGSAGGEPMLYVFSAGNRGEGELSRSQSGNLSIQADGKRVAVAEPLSRMDAGKDSGVLAAASDKVDSWRQARQESLPELRAKENAKGEALADGSVKAGVPYFVDVNRNGRFEQTGMPATPAQPARPNLDAVELNFTSPTGAPAKPGSSTPGNMVGSGGVALGDAQKNVWYDNSKVVAGATVADPKWAGTLQSPAAGNLPQGDRENEFVGRNAMVVLPYGKSLDLNQIQDEAKNPMPANQPQVGQTDGLAVITGGLRSNLGVAVNGLPPVTTDFGTRAKAVQMGKDFDADFIDGHAEKLTKQQVDRLGASMADGRKFNDPVAKMDGFNLDVIDLQVVKSLDETEWAKGVSAGMKLSEPAPVLGMDLYATTEEAAKRQATETVMKESAARAEVLKREGKLAEAKVMEDEAARLSRRLVVNRTEGESVAKGNKEEVTKLVQDAKQLYDLRKPEEAEAKLREVIKQDPANSAAYYYMNLVQEDKQGDLGRKRDYEQRSRIVNVEKAWEIPATRESLAEVKESQLPKAPAVVDELAKLSGENKPVAALQQLVKQKEELKAEVKKAAKEEDVEKKPVPAPPGIPQPEVSTAENAFSTFSLNVSDVSFKLAAASLEKGLMPEVGSVRTEEFINAFNYHDPEPTGSSRVAFAWERARYPYAHDRDLVRFSVQTAAVGREPGKPLNIVLLLDNSGSMERADRIRIRQECLRVLGSQLQPQDKVSVVAFARTARLWVDGLAGAQANELPERVGNLTPEGGTNLEEAMNLAYQTAQRHFVPNGVNRVVLLTDGAANLGDVQPESLKKKVVSYRQQGVALDCFGIGWEGYNDDLLEALSRNGDGRYGFVNSPEAATTEFASQLAGALKVAASDVKVQVEWNPKRVTVFRQLGYAKHQLKKEEFRDNTVDAAEIGAAEAGNALYTVQVNPAGEGPLGVVRVRYRVPNTNDYREQEWPLAYDGASKDMQQASLPLRLAGTASAFSEWLVTSPYAAEVTPEKLIAQMAGVPEAYPADPRPKQLEWMIRQAKSLSGR